MTDLERLWDDYPTGTPPTREILAAAAGGRRPRRPLWQRPLLTAGLVTGLAAAFLAGVSMGGDDSGPSGPGADQPSRVAFQADLQPAKSCDDLLATYIARGKKLVGPWGWGGDLAWAYDDALTAASDRLSLNGLARFDAAEKAPAPQTDRQVNSETGTNVQEAAVDEPDTVKTDGSVLVTVRDDRLVTYDVTGNRPRRLSSLRLTSIEDAEIMLSGDTVVAIGEDATADRPDASMLGGSTRVLTVSIADAARPKIVEDVAYDAGLASARQHGSTIRLVLASGLPDLKFVEPRGKRSPAQAERANRRLVANTTIEDWLPTVTTDDKTAQLLDCTNVAVPDDDVTLDTTSVVGFDASKPAAVDAIGLAGRADIAYESADHLYLATNGGYAPGWGDCVTCTSVVRPQFGEPSGTSYLFDFELDGVQATHVASGEVEGSIRDRWSIDEADGVLRVAVGPTSETGNFNAILTLRRDGTELVEEGRLDRLGRNEEIKSMRWFDDLAIMVTFRQVDPLYAIDLTNTRHPKLLGKLKVPGFSSYLHPLGSWRMIGVGEGPGKKGWGAQVGLFNVRDITKVHRMDVLNYGRRFQALAGTDPRAFTWLPDQRTAITVLERRTSRRVGYVSILKLRNGRFHQRLQQVEYGADVDDVRAVPLPDGRVVLVTGDGAQFLEL